MQRFLGNKHVVFGKGRKGILKGGWPNSVFFVCITLGTALHTLRPGAQAG